MPGEQPTGGSGLGSLGAVLNPHLVLTYIPILWTFEIALAITCLLFLSLGHILSTVGTHSWRG